MKTENEIKLEYGNSYRRARLPDSVGWLPLTKNQSEAIRSKPSLKTAIHELLSLDTCRNALKRAHAKITLIVPDHTRYCRLPEILAELIPVLKTGNRPEIAILIANGTHKLSSAALALELTGERVSAEIPVFQHDCYDRRSLAYLGETSFGTPIWLNRKVIESDLVITICGVLFHYFAGFGGGPKMLLPGVAGYETILINHRRTIDPHSGDFHADCFEGHIDTNPVYVDLAEIVKFVPQAVSLQVVLDLNRAIAQIEVGSPVLAHKKITAVVKTLYEIPMRQKADVVVASAGGFPADVNLIQAHKSIHHAFAAVKSGGSVIVFAECSEGIGSSSFLNYFDGASASEIGRRLLRDFQLNGHTALALKRKTEQAQIILISHLKPSLVERCGMIPAPSFQAAWQIVEGSGKKPTTGYVFKKAAYFVPQIAAMGTDINSGGLP